jgi:phage-related minor tail protein
MGDIGQVMGAVSQRTGLTGEGLEALTGQIMNFSRMTGVDGVAATENLTGVMGQFGIEASGAGELLNQLYGAGQQFGVSFDQLTAQLTKFGQPLQNMGFSLEQSIGMLGQWEQKGVNSQAMLAGLSAASAKFATDGIPMQTGLQDTIAAIQGAATETEALGIAYEIFGRKAGAEMVAAIQNGNLSIDAATALCRGRAVRLTMRRGVCSIFPMRGKWRRSKSRRRLCRWARAWPS